MNARCPGPAPGSYKPLSRHCQTRFLCKHIAIVCNLNYRVLFGCRHTCNIKFVCSATAGVPEGLILNLFDFIIACCHIVFVSVVARIHGK